MDLSDSTFLKMLGTLAAAAPEEIPDFIEFEAKSIPLAPVAPFEFTDRESDAYREMRDEVLASTGVDEGWLVMRANQVLQAHNANERVGELIAYFKKMNQWLAHRHLTRRQNDMARFMGWRSCYAMNVLANLLGIETKDVRSLAEFLGRQIIEGK